MMVRSFVLVTQLHFQWFCVHDTALRIVAAVYETLSPFMTEMRKDMAAVREDLTRIEEKVDSLSRDLEEHKNKTEAPPIHECEGTGWRRVVYLDMTDPNTNCPSGWQLTSHSKRTCGKVSTSSLSCDSVFFPVSGGHYTSVCGSIRAYQQGHTDAFEAYHDGEVTTIEGDSDPGVFYPDDPLWDGEDCSSSSSCCSFNNPPYFTKQLPSPTSDPIEARLCRLEGGDDDSPVEFMELYVK